MCYCPIRGGGRQKNRGEGGTNDGFSISASVLFSISTKSRGSLWSPPAPLFPTTLVIVPVAA